jgi:hypothetical protein
LLDIAGVFDTVNYIYLLDNLQKKGVLYWIVQILKSFLTDGATTLVVDSKETELYRLNASIPQGSLLSPILFLFYNVPLLEKLYQPNLLLILLGFADDINLLIYRKTTAVNCSNLELVYKYCLDWACIYSIQFALQKYTLTYLTRYRRLDLEVPVTLQDTAIQPTTVVQILGIQLDSKLQWKAQEKAIQAKMNTQMLALQRTTASTWRATIPKARQVYQAVIRSALLYRASIWQPLLGKPKGLVVRLQKYQNQGLCTVLGTYRAIPAHMLETELYIPLLDLWLNGQVARFQARLECSGIA